jgi:putative DNA primase/helicase
VRDIADLNKLPVEMVAAPAIVAAGAVVGRAIGIRPGSFDDFTVVPNFWGALIARPGWMKTGAVNEAFRPLGRLAAAAHDAYVAAESDLEVTRERIEAEIDAIKRTMRDAAKKGADLSNHEGNLRAKRGELHASNVTERRYLTHESTVEKLGELLRDNSRGMLVLRDELSGWLRALEKPGREGDREFYLEAWNGTGSFTTDRIGRGTVHIPALTLSLFGGIQPGKLAPLLASATEGGVGDDGLVQRLQVTVWPDRLPPWSKPTRWLDAAARDRAAQVFDALAAIDGPAVGANNDEIPFLRFSSSAQSVADDWRDGIEHRLRSGELDDTPAFAAHIAKYRSLMPALALVFSLIDRVAKTPGVATGAIDEAHTRLAADWCGFLEAHARKLYAVELHAGASAAHAIAAKIQAGAIFDGQSVRELYRAQWAGLRTAEQVLAGLTELTDLGWLRMEFALTGGRPTQVVRLHPDLSESTDTPNPSGDRHDA